MLFLKNFSEMSNAELATATVRYGEIPVRSMRFFNDVTGRNYRTIREALNFDKVLEQLYTDDFGLDMPFDELLRLEYGKKEIKVTDLPDLVYNYLVNTPFLVIETDYRQALMTVRNAFIQLSNPANNPSH